MVEEWEAAHAAASHGPCRSFRKLRGRRRRPLGTGAPMLEPMYSAGKALNLGHNRTSVNENQTERPFPSSGWSEPEQRRAAEKQALLCVAGGTARWSALSEEQCGNLYGNCECICPLTEPFHF